MAVPEIARITVPATLTPLSLVGLEHALAAAMQGSSQVVLLEGSIECFCLGMHLEVSEPDGTEQAIDHWEPPGMAPGAYTPEIRAALDRFVHCLEFIRLGPKATIAVVRGDARGGGVGIAAACDLVIATSAASFGLPEVLFGLLPAVILPLLLERMPAQKARLLALSGQSIDATAAAAVGLVDEMVTEASLTGAIRQAARRTGRAQRTTVSLLKHYTASSATPFPRAPGTGQDAVDGTLNSSVEPGNTNLAERPGDTTGGLNSDGSDYARTELGERLRRGAGMTAALLHSQHVEAATRAFAVEGGAPWLMQ